MLIDLGEYYIRSYEKSDKDTLVKYANNYNVSKNLRDSFPYPYTEKDANRWIGLVFGQTPELNFAIADKNELIGAIGIMLQPDVYRFSAEIGYWLAEPFWGKGIATQAVKKMTGFAFSQFKFNRLFAGGFEGNESSLRVLEKAGYKLEGNYRKAVYKENKFRDQLMYSILKEELDLK